MTPRFVKEKLKCSTFAFFFLIESAHSWAAGTKLSATTAGLSSAAGNTSAGMEEEVVEEEEEDVEEEEEEFMASFCNNKENIY